MAPVLLAAAVLLAAGPKGGKAPPKEPAPAAAKPAPTPDVDGPSVLHTPIKETEYSKEFTVTAEMADASGIFQPLVFWRLVGESSFIQVPMKHRSGDEYQVTIPANKIIADFEYFVEAYDSQGNGPTRVGSPERPLSVRVPNAMLGSAPAGEPAAAAAPAPPEIASSEGGGLRIGPLVATGAGAVLVAVGAVLYMGATSTIAEIDGKYAAGVGRLPADAQATRDAMSSGQLGSILMIAGGVATAGGVAWWAMPPSSPGGGAMLTVGARF